MHVHFSCTLYTESVVLVRLVAKYLRAAHHAREGRQPVQRRGGERAGVGLAAQGVGPHLARVLLL